MARYEQIASDLRDAIVRGGYPIGAQLPSEAELALRYSAARGTVRQAVALLAAEGLVGSRQGARRIVLGSERSQSFAELHSFAQWARSMGYRASGTVLSSQRRPCSPSEAVRLSLEPGRRCSTCCGCGGSTANRCWSSAPSTPGGSPPPSSGSTPTASR
ncbi:hypothetical protein GCM10027612_71690 [Microbispora bryophytorum subsp. camponoti]